MPNYIRSADTSTGAAYSRTELERIVTRYGCTRFGTETDQEAGTLRVWFVVPDHKAEGGEMSRVPVRLEVKLGAVADRLRTLMASREWKAKRRGGEPLPEQVERVAWRHIVLLVQAGLEAAEAGVKPVSEFFMADTVLEDGRGRSRRLVTVLGELAPEWRERLALGPGGS